MVPIKRPDVEDRVHLHVLRRARLRRYGEDYAAVLHSVVLAKKLGYGGYLRILIRIGL